MNIVQVEDFFHPDTGYQINILSKYLQKFGHQVTIITAELEKIPDSLTSFFGKENISERDRIYEDTYGVHIHRLPVKNYISGRVIFTDELLPTIRSYAPDILFVHGCDTATAMWALWNRKKIGCPLFSDCHMDVTASTNRFAPIFRQFYRTVMTPIIKKEHCYVPALGETRYAEYYLGIPRELSPLIGFGSDEVLFHPDASARADFRREHGISEDAFVALYAGKLDPYKDGQFLADLTCEHIETQREIVYVIIGNTVGEYGRNVEKRFQESPYRLLRFPSQKYCDLPRFFQAADLALIPHQASLTLFDYNSTGLPVLAENNKGNLERCGHGNGWVFQEKDIQDFKAKLEAILALSKEEFQDVSNTAVAYIRKDFSYEKKAREFEKLLLETVSRSQRHK